MTALALLIVLRLVDGIFLGGESTAASPLAMEYSPKAERGLYSAIIQAGYPIAYIAISLFTALMLFLAPPKGLHSAYVQWGWRIPFVVGALIALGFRRLVSHRSGLEVVAGGAQDREPDRVAVRRPQLAARPVPVVDLDDGLLAVPGTPPSAPFLSC